MKSFNNFDTSSTGCNITGHAFYDTSLARFYFEDNFEVLRFSDNRHHSILYYVDYGNLPGPEDVTFTLEATTEAKAKYLEGEGYDFPSLTAEGVNIDAEILASIRPTIADWVSGLLAEEYPGFTFIPSKPLEIYNLRGYSQGDFAQAIVCLDDLESAWGKRPTDKELRDTLYHLVYDAPVSATLTVDGEEFYYSDTPGLKSEYEWDKAAFIAYVVSKSKATPEALSALLPNNLEYN